MNWRNRSTYAEGMHLTGRSVKVLTLTARPNNQWHLLIGGELPITMPMLGLLVLWAPGSRWRWVSILSDKWWRHSGHRCVTCSGVNAHRVRVIQSLLLHRCYRRTCRTQMLGPADSHAHAHTVNMRVKWRTAILVEIFQITVDIVRRKCAQLGIDRRGLSS